MMSFILHLKIPFKMQDQLKSYFFFNEFDQTFVQRFSELSENRRVASHQILTGRTDRSETALEIMNHQ